MKVVITGAESSGKTTLFESLEKYYGIVGAKEFARNYLLNSNGKYSQKDLISIANGQIDAEINVKKNNPDLVICDTDLLTIKIWSQYKYGDCDKQIHNLLNSYPADLYLLMKPDIPWEDDPLRENPDDRWDIFGIYKQELAILGVPFFTISGSKKNRLRKSISIIDKFLLTN